MKRKQKSKRVVRKKLSLSAKRSKHLSPTVTNTLRYIEKNLPHIETSSDISRAMRLSREHVSRVFSKQVGQKMWEYVNAAKVERAKKLLSDKSRLVKQIYPELGFGCQSTFYNAFRRYAGMTPGKFRKLRFGKKKGR